MDNVKFVRVTKSSSTSGLELKINEIIQENSTKAELKDIEFSSFTKNGAQHMIALLIFDENK